MNLLDRLDRALASVLDRNALREELSRIREGVSLEEREAAAHRELLATVVDIEDAATGTVRLRRKVEAADEMALDTRSTKTVRVGRAQ